MFYFTKGKERERKIYNADADAEISKWPYVNIRKFRPQAKKKKVVFLLKKHVSQCCNSIFCNHSVYNDTLTEAATRGVQSLSFNKVAGLETLAHVISCKF